MSMQGTIFANVTGRTDIALENIFQNIYVN